MLLVEITINGTLHRVSDETRAVTNQWLGYVSNFDPPQYNQATIYGGWTKLSFGSISFTNNLFSSNWPPPLSCPITIKYTDSGNPIEATAKTYFSGIAHWKTATKDEVTYDLYGNSYNKNLLTNSTDYNGNVVPLPRAFGTVIHVTPVKLPDSSGLPTFHKGYFGSTIPGSSWNTYDDGVDINANVRPNPNGTFSLSATPVGEVTISGKAKQTTVNSILKWSASSNNLNLSYSSAYAEQPSPSVNFWAQSQTKTVDFLSELTAYNTHTYYISTGTIHLVNLHTANSSRTLTEFDCLLSQYYAEQPISGVKASWEKREAAVMTLTGSTGQGRYIKRSNIEASVNSTYDYGDQIDITPFTSGNTAILTQLADIRDISNSRKMSVSIPLTTNIPRPGEKISFTNETIEVPTKMSIYARELRFDLIKQDITITGEGTMSTAT